MVEILIVVVVASLGFAAITGVVEVVERRGARRAEIRRRLGL